MKRLIVTADDFGYSSFVNRAIIHCFRKGIVTSASFIANTQYFSESIRMLRQNKKLDIGLHVNLTEFFPLTRAKTLTGTNGKFLDKNEWHNGYCSNADRHEIENEIESQIIKFLSSGLNLTHINGHNHIHVFPEIIDIIVKLAKRHGIRYVRLPDERIINKNQRLSDEIQKRNVLAKFSKAARNKIIKNRLETTNSFYGILDMNNMDFYRMSLILDSIEDGTTELMVHPAYADKRGDIFHRSIQREREIRILTDYKIKKMIGKNGIKLANYSQT